jgi:hypothetical protein
MESRASRVFRGFAVAAVATFVAAFFHVAGGGAPPSILALTLTMAFAGLSSIFLLGRRLSAWRQAAAVAVSQLLFHVLFVIGTPAGGLSVASGSHLHSGAHLQFSEAGGSVAADSAMGSMSLLPTPAMWFAHVCAATLTIFAVRFGERAFWGLLETARLALSRLAVIQWSPTLEPAPLTAAAFVSNEPLIANLGVLVGRMRHRGPPPAGIATAH